MDYLSKISMQGESRGYNGDLDPNEANQEEYVLLGESYPALLLNNDNRTGEEDKNASEHYLTRLIGGLFSKNMDENPDFLLDLKSRLHFTYRTRFTPILAVPGGPSPLSFHFLIRENPINVIENAINNPSCFNTDVGWGCMIRTGQSLLGNAVQIARLGREYRVGPELNPEEIMIIDWFVDIPDAPFSIHNFVSRGMELSGKRPGEWSGPAATSRSIQSLIRGFKQCGIDDCQISVASGDVYEEEVMEVFSKSKENRILFLLGVKLGINAVNEFYWIDIKRLLGSKFSVGIAGGRPSSSLYFIGYQGDELLYLDPHTAQPFVSPSNQQRSFYESCHSSNYGKLAIQDLDPSMLIGILISGKEEFEEWKKEVKDSHIINILEKKPGPMESVFDGDLDSFNMPDNDGFNDKSTIVDGDYVDIRAVLRHSDSASSCEKDDGFQDIQCKKQHIVVIGDRSSSTTSQDVEVEKVLVEHETVGVSDSRNNEVADIR
ncbi:cysteine protease atg4 [Zygosaccharomyces mellis]|uniref:Cysteine protease n=1 Tax=Zygosaccharomyces mellis TaxID=42258 RepID=A0A4C2EED5_9SACH|nr:cysteine protease atg4 [Zygosaccharomyces mellis]